MQARRDNLTATLLAGHDYRQVYSAKRYDTSARPFNQRRGRRSAACAGWAAPFSAHHTHNGRLAVVRLGTGRVTDIAA